MDNILKCIAFRTSGNLFVQRMNNKRRDSPAGQTRLGPYSKAIDRGAVGWSLDGRSREGRFLRNYERMLADHVAGAGGMPSTVQRELIRRAARLALHIELQDERFMAGREPSDHAGKQYLAWSASLVRTLKVLGVAPAAAKPTETLASYLANYDSRPGQAQQPDREAA